MTQHLPFGREEQSPPHFLRLNHPYGYFHQVLIQTLQGAHRPTGPVRGPCRFEPPLKSNAKPNRHGPLLGHSYSQARPELSILPKETVKGTTRTFCVIAFGGYYYRPRSDLPSFPGLLYLESHRFRTKLLSLPRISEGVSLESADLDECLLLHRNQQSTLQRFGL